MAKLNLNSVSNEVFAINGNDQREDIVAKGRVLFYEHALKGKMALLSAKGQNTPVQRTMNDRGYKQLNEQFQRESLLYAAKLACASTGKKAPESWEEFKRNGGEYYGNARFYAVLQGIWQEVIIPILPAVYSEALSDFAETVEIELGQTYAVSIGSNDIPVFQDSSWGASRSVPRNRFYSRDYTLNPTPKSCWITAKWMQLVGTNMDFGVFFANMVAGMYAKTMGMWNEAMTTATEDTSLIPTNLNFTFNNQNWVKGANKIAALNNTTISDVFATGGTVALSKVLPNTVTGSTNVNMDAAIATLLGADYTKAGYLGQFMAVRLMPMRDVIIPGTQNTTVETMLSENDIWMLAGNGRKPLTIGYTSGTPISIEMDPTRAADFEIGINLTIALDSVATFASKIAHFTV
uniref:Major capsid protein n=1 Tax=Siphoviridae sp. ctBeL15 TaxID=2825374 RepID=A0A8S5V021_9CAUD|nr:MAG TPA: hypothetical protein [Siphoviridae sp. ctBeL15]